MKSKKIRSKEERAKLLKRLQAYAKKQNKTVQEVFFFFADKVELHLLIEAKKNKKPSI